MIRGVYALADGTEVTIFNGSFPAKDESRDHPLKFPAKEVFYQDLLTTLRPSTHRMIILW